MRRDSAADATRAPLIHWAWGTAYDLFASLYVLHNPESTGLRKAWAAGVRNRLSVSNRDLLQLLSDVIAVPVEWIEQLGEGATAEQVTRALSQLPDEDVLPELSDGEFISHPILAEVMTSGRVTGEATTALMESTSFEVPLPATAEGTRKLLALYADRAQSGRKFKTAMSEYWERFFCEEEQRIAPYLESSLHRAQQLAGSLGAVDLIENLTGGLRLETAAEATRLLFIPSFWAGPLTIFEMLADNTWAILFTARPRDVSLVPGDPVPDALLRSLSALADQTRLRILKILAQVPRTQVEISRELRLRPPTITHHLRILRLANIVRLNESSTGEKTYDLRKSRLGEITADMVRFVGIE